MISVFALLAACSGPGTGPDQVLPGVASFHGVELSLPARGLVLRAAHAQTLEPQRGDATDVEAQLGGEPGLSIVSEHASWDLRGQEVVFEGAVRADRGAFTLTCDQLRAVFDSPEQLRRAEASGDVRVHHGERVATGARATMDIELGRLELEGQPVITAGGRSLRGERIVLFLDDERLECHRCVLVIAEDGAPLPNNGTEADGS